MDFHLPLKPEAATPKKHEDAQAESTKLPKMFKIQPNGVFLRTETAMEEYNKEFVWFDPK